MPRYKKITKLDVDYSFYEELRSNDEMVETEFLCRDSRRAKHPKFVGDVFSVSAYGKKFVAIKTNFGITRTHYRHGKRSKRIVDYKEYFDVLFILTEKGWKYIKGMIVEKEIEDYANASV